MSSRLKRTGRSDPAEHFTKMFRSTLTCAAWRELSTTAQAIYPFLKFEWKGPKFNNNGKIQLSCRQAAKLVGVTRNTASKALHELQAKGFIHVTELGALGVYGEARGPSYEITELALPTAEKSNGRMLYLRWRPGSDFPVIKHRSNNPTGNN